MSTSVDVDYCLILIDKLISPNTPKPDERWMVRELMLAVRHQEMKDLVLGFVDQDLSLEEKKTMKERFRCFDHEGPDDQREAEIDYKELIEKLLDPKLPESEYKPTLQALLEGDLEQDKKNLVSAIISCQNNDQRANMVKRFKSSFDREKEEVERAKREKLEAKAAKKAARAKMEEDLLKFEDDGLQLIMKLLDAKIPVNLKSKIYDRLMEEDIQADIKNLAIQVLEPENASKKFVLLEDFKKEREAEKIKAAQRKEQADKQKAVEEMKRKLEKKQQHQLVEEQKKKKIGKESREKEKKKKDGRLNAVPGLYKTQIVERGDPTRKQQQQPTGQRKEKKKCDQDGRKDERLNGVAVPGPSRAQVEERGDREDRRSREEEITRKLLKKQRREQKEKNNREKEARREERRNSVAGPGSAQEWGGKEDKEDRLSKEEKIRRKLKKQRQQHKEKQREKKVRETDGKDERTGMEGGLSREEEIQRKLLNMPEAEETLNELAGPGPSPGPSNTEVEEMEEEQSWEVHSFDPDCLEDFQIVLPGLESSLEPSEQDQYRRDFAALQIERDWLREES